jgi:hypothetical protein
MPASARPFRPALGSLDARIVPSGTPLDLTAKGASGDAAGGIVRQTDAQPTGTGVIHSFVRVQGPASGGTEQGYNTDARPLQFDENKSPVFTRGLTVGQVPVVNVGGVNYREFLLDINQKASASKLSLDEVRIFLTDGPKAVGYDAATKTLAGKAAVYDLDADGDKTIILDARLNNGSGSGDMILLVPDAAFAGADVGTHVSVYSKFGGTHQANGGFEEWAVRSTGGPVAPPPVPLGSLGGTVYLDANKNGAFDAGEAGIGGVTIQLQGVNDLGQTVVLTATSNADGSYRFGDLRPGTYSIFEAQPSLYDDGSETVGSLGGLNSANDTFSEILVYFGANGVGYDFGELVREGGGGVEA